MTIAATKPARRYLQFRLKTLFVFVAVTSVPCGWLAWRMEHKRLERMAVAEITKLGGQVRYDWQDSQKKEPTGAAWLRRLLGEDFFSSVIAVDINSHNVTDDSLVHVEPLADLVNLGLWDSCEQVTDRGLSHLTGLSKLKVLYLSDTGITNDGLVHLHGLNRLQTLYLSGTKITNGGLMYLKEFPRLRSLYIFNTAVSDAGVAKLQKALPNCRILR
jgi:hypothetical protein